MATKRKSAATIGEIQGELTALRDELGDLAEQVTVLLSDKGDEVVDDVKKRVSRIRDSIDSAISDAGARGRAAMQDTAGSLKDMGGTLSDTLEESVRERPFTMLALAIGLGVVVGTTLRR